jgi:plastocyanin
LRIVKAMRLLTLSTLVLAAALGLAACGSGGGEESTTPSAGGGESISISETEFKLDPSTVSVDAPGTVTIKVTNDGAIDHALEIDGQGIEEETETIKPGESAELTVDLSKSGEYELYCPIGNHREQGMEGTLTLGPGGVTGGTGTDKGEDEDTTTDDGYGYGSG